MTDSVNHPPDAKARILILCGKSASGKDAILKSLVNRGFCPIVSLTTRPIRIGEINGKDYKFISKADFMELISDNKMVEYRSYVTTVNGVVDEWFYGTAKTELDSSKIYVVVLDLDGTKKVSEYYGKDNCFIVYVDVPENIRTERAKSRGSFDLTEWTRRLDSDNSVFSIENVHRYADIIVDNSGDLEKSVNEIVISFVRERGNDREESVSQTDSGAKKARSSILFDTI